MARAGEPNVDRRTLLEGVVGAGLGATLFGSTPALADEDDCPGVDSGTWTRPNCRYDPADNRVVSTFKIHAPDGEGWTVRHRALDQDTRDLVDAGGSLIIISSHCVFINLEYEKDEIDTGLEDVLFTYELAESRAELDAGNTFFEATCDPLGCSLAVTGDADPRASGGPPRCEWMFALDCGGNCPAVDPSVTVSFDGKPPLDSFTLDCDTPEETVTLLPNKEYTVTYSDVADVDISGAPTTVSCGNPGKGNGKP